MINKMMLNVLYEDNHLIAVYKPANVLVQCDESGDECLMDVVKKYLKEKYHKPGNVFLGLLHRLDRPVSGIVLFAKTSKGASRLSKQFREHKIKKIYYALVSGVLKNPKGTLIHYLIKDHIKNKVKIFDFETAGAKRSELDYEVVSTKNNQSLLKILLKTGRSHQIRAQLSSMGHPIIGDLKYGALTPLPNKAIALSAVELAFKLATKEEMKTLQISPKEESCLRFFPE